MNKFWFRNKYRRHLADMHIPDFDDKFLSRFDVDDYVKNLKTAKMQSAMIYTQSHVGLCYFPTKVGKTHRAFAKDGKIKQLVEKCRAEGIATVGYYSLIHNNEEYYAHPSWRIINGDGTTQTANGGRYGFVCPENDEYREFLKIQLKEIFDYFGDFDGMFFDMPFWPDFCHCESCKKKFREFTGAEMPHEKDKDWKNPIWKKWIALREKQMAEFAYFIREETHKLRPDVTVTLNCAGSVAFDWWASSTDKIGDACDYVGGDLYGDLYNHSFTCKYYDTVTNYKPFEYMLGTCESNLREHTVTKTENKLKTEVCLTAAHHGATMMIDALDPIGTMNEKRYEQIGRVFGFESKLEKYFDGEYVGEIALYYDTSSKFNRFEAGFSNRTVAINFNKNMIRRKVPCKVIANGHFGDINGYRMVFAPCLENVERRENADLIKYVENGGTLYLSYASDNELMKEFFGAEIKGLTEYTKTYVRPTAAGQKYFGENDEKYPLSINYALPVLETYDKKAEVLAKITVPYSVQSDNIHFASIHSDPPWRDTEMPAMLRVKYGKGTVIWSAAAIEDDQRKQYRDVIMTFIDEYVGKDRFMLAECSSDIEIITFKRENGYSVSLVDLNVQDDFIEERKFALSLKTEKKPAAVFDAVTGESMPFGYDNGRLRIENTLKLFLMLIIEM